MKDLGLKIRDYRKSQGMTQETLAQLIGVKRAVVSKYETNSISPSLDMLKKIADALNVSLPELLFDSIAQSAQDAIVSNNYMQKMALEALEALTEAGKDVATDIKRTKLLSSFDQLNSDGQNKVIEYANDITPKYKK